MGKRRNKNKVNQEDFVVSFPALRKTQEADWSASDASDGESCVTHVTLDDMHCINGDNSGEDENIFLETATLSDYLGGFIENATHKNMSARLVALDNIAALLTQRFMAPEMEKWIATVIDVIEKTLRKTDEEAVRAAHLAALMSFQFGERVNCEMESVVRCLRQMCIDPTRSVQLRTQCLRSVALCTLLSLFQPTSVISSVNALRSVWFHAKSNVACTALFCAALSGWSLLIHQGEDMLAAALKDEPKLSTFINSTQLEMRLTAGEALAVIHEAAVAAYGDNFQFPNQQHILGIFATLATDSLKFRAKKDRRIQRLTFRQIYTAVKDQKVPVFAVRFGNETLKIDSCGKKLFYEFACDILRNGICAHLRMNPVLRDWFDLGPVTELYSIKMNKPQRVAIQNAVNKSRDLQRSKQRDKRFAI